jgi:sec-independent protein translocase protein TatC
MSGEPEQLAEGTLISHLLELRTRLMRAFLAVIIVFLPCAYFANDLFEFAARPLLAQLPAGGSLIATSITAPFMTPFKLAFVVALVLAMPFVLYELWAFVAPGLYRREKRFARPLLASSIFLFYCGVAFAYWVVFPVIFKFFISTAPRGVAVMTDITNYMDFILMMVLSFGVAFEVPIAVVLLVMTGLVNVDKLTSIRGYVLIAIFIIAALLTPPDLISQSIMAIPMYLLYEGGIVFARLLSNRKAAEKAAEEKTV